MLSGPAKKTERFLYLASGSDCCEAIGGPERARASSRGGFCYD